MHPGFAFIPRLPRGYSTGKTEGKHSFNWVTVINNQAGVGGIKERRQVRVDCRFDGDGLQSLFPMGPRVFDKLSSRFVLLNSNCFLLQQWVC